ncbi:MAG: MFS transporter [Burkholderiales bacterium]|nr:MFS transporter [Burkholderiales bacterium]
MNAGALPWGRLGAYGVLALPLAMAALPVYVHLPKLYADNLGLPLGIVGGVLLAARLLDAAQDTLIGWWSDHAANHRGGRERLVLIGVPLLALGMIGLFHPPEGISIALAGWLAGCLVVTYLGFSMATISYFAIGAALSPDYHERTRITAVRSVFGIVGVLLAAALPEWLGANSNAADGLRIFSLAYVPILLAGTAALLFGAPRAAITSTRHAARGLRASIVAPLRNAAFRWLLLVFVISGIASAIPATLILFYVQDVLGAPHLNAAFLGTYFVFGALGMPLWVWTSRRIGKKGAWQLGMGMSIVAFVGALFLGNGDAWAFGLVCALSGIAYGAELALPPSILADVVDRDTTGADSGAVGDSSRPDGAYFGLWQVSEKLNLALAAGIALPVVGLLGYVPGTSQGPLGPVSFVYAAVPCVLKLIAVLALQIAPVDRPTWSDAPSTGEVAP